MAIHPSLTFLLMAHLMKKNHNIFTKVNIFLVRQTVSVVADEKKSKFQPESMFLRVEAK